MLPSACLLPGCLQQVELGQMEGRIGELAAGLMGGRKPGILSVSMLSFRVCVH